MRFLKESVVSVVGIAVLTLSIQAQELSSDQQPKSPKAMKSHPDFGTASETVINVPSYAFQGYSPSTDQITDDGFFFRYFSTLGSRDMFAPVIGIPSGVIIDEVDLNDCSTGTGMTVGLFIGDWNQNLSGGIQEIAAFDTNPGCGIDSITGLNYEYPANLGGQGTNPGGPLFVTVYFHANVGSGNKFNDVAIYFHRIVSPSPTAATFADVPTSSPQFQFVEALVAAGITAGCGGGDYCPDNPVTRGQMAVFLAKALGLHWPN
jgi:hypothetical protein